MEDSTQKYFEKQIESKETLVKSITENLIGIDALIDGPFESHKQVYADYAASGKAVKFIEDYIRNEVLPVYSNTHTSSSFVGIQTSCFREEARGIIRDTVRRWTPAFTPSTAARKTMSFSLQETDARERSTRSCAFSDWSARPLRTAPQSR